MVYDAHWNCKVLIVILKLKVWISLRHGVLNTTLYVIKFVNDFQQVGGFLRVRKFPSPIKLTATI